MYKRVKVLLLCLILLPGLCGCWNYRGLDQLDIVVGIAIDLDEESGDYAISYEAADLAGADKKGSVQGKIVTSQGKTLFDTARNAKRNEADKLFFGSSNVLVLSQKVIKEKGVLPVIEWFLRDGECRETLCVAISQEETAAVILQRPEKMKGIMSVILHDIIREDNAVSASALHIQLYEVFNSLSSPRRCAVLPVLRRVENGGETVSGINGVAVVKEDGVVGFLTPEQSKYALVMEDKMTSGIITLSMAGEKADDISLEVFGSKTKRRFTYEEGKFTFHIDIKTKVAVAENQSMMDMADPEKIKQIKKAAEQKIEENMYALLDVVQREYKADIFGLGEMVYQKNLPLWKQLESDWDQIYPTVAVEVTSEVQIVNSGFIK